MDKLEYLAKTLSRTKRKDYENYVVNAVWNRLDDDSLRPVSQQWIARSDGKGYFIDLYFPQVNMGVECDESYHKTQWDKDRARELDLIDILRRIDDSSGYRALHVDISQGYAAVEGQIDEAARTIREEARRRSSEGTLVPWDPEPKIEDFLALHDTIRVSDEVSFPTIRVACNALFATAYRESKGRTRACFVPRGRFREAFPGWRAWFPAKVATDGSGRQGWLNIVSPDGSELYEGREGRDFEDDGTKDTRIVFLRAKDPVTGISGYRFLGVFVPDGTKVVDGRAYRRRVRVSEEIGIIKE